LVGEERPSNTSEPSGSGTSLTAGFGNLLLTFPAIGHAAERANDADKRPAIHARITFGRALLVEAGPANHRVTLAQDLAHLCCWGHR
ncbi:MAG: hypothetical protein ACJ8AJ_12860, partial [Gemmatimonadaceae bacterium]